MSSGEGHDVIGRRVIHLATTTSTMDEVARLAAAGEAEGVVVRADLQTAGRGRAGRRWTVPAGSSILASFLLRPDVPAERLTLLPLMMGVAVAKTVERTIDRPCQLKWPNDVWVDEQKLCGVLMSARSVGTSVPAVVLGIGLNGNIPAGELMPGATSLLAASGRRHDLDAVFATLLTELNVAYREFRVAGGAPSLGGWRARMALHDEPVMVRDADETVSGQLRGIDDRGRLLLEVAPGDIREIAAGELTRGPVRR